MIFKHFLLKNKNDKNTDNLFKTIDDIYDTHIQLYNSHM